MVTDEHAGVLEVLREGYEREAGQLAFYRALRDAAREAGDEEQAARLGGLLADEDRHLVRLGARLRELGADPPEVSDADPRVQLGGWVAEARAREAGEVAFYKAVLARRLDEATRELLQEILQVERRHREALGRRWVPV
jgi:rubrerythrin